MDNTPVEIPDSLWERLRSDKRRLALVCVGVAAALALAAVFVVRPLMSRDADSRIDIPGRLPVSGDSTDSAAEPPVATDATSQPATDDGPDGGDTTTGAPPGDSAKPAVSRAPFVAYRAAGAVWIAAEDGSGARRIASMTPGTFSLSPDATILARIDAGGLALIDVADGTVVTVGGAHPGEMAWTADSSALYYTGESRNGTTDVMKVPRSGRTATAVAQGSRPALAPDGRLVMIGAETPGEPSSGSPQGTLLVVTPGGAISTIRTTGRPSSCAVAGDRVFFATHGSSAADGAQERAVDPMLRSVTLAGTTELVVRGKPAGARPFGYDRLCASPDGRYLLYAEVGDDGYSRAFILDVASSTSIALSVRRDTYPLCWSADGRRAFFIEGNSWQGEPTDLMSIRPDGMGRVVVVDGAGL